MKHRNSTRQIVADLLVNGRDDVIKSRAADRLKILQDALGGALIELKAGNHQCQNPTCGIEYAKNVYQLSVGA